MNKTEFVNALADKMKSTKAEATRALNAIIETVKKTLKKGEEIRIIGFGTFKVVKVAAKTVRNPQNGKPINVPARKRTKFVVGKDLKKAVNS